MTAPREIPGPVGRLESLLDEPRRETGASSGGLIHRGSAKGPRAAVVFGHPHPQHGGTMHTKATYQSAKALQRIGCAVLRFNFRGCGLSQGVFDEGAGERDDFKAALDFMAARYPGVPLWAAGFSFGSHVALEVGAQDPRVAVLIAVAPPVAREGYDFSNTKVSTKPKFFIQGSEDELCFIEPLWAFYAKLEEPKELVIIDGADHLFTGQTAEVGEAIEDLLGDYE